MKTMAIRSSSALILLLLLVSLCLIFLLRVKNEMLDFEVNYQAAQRLRLGETLYRASDGHYQFKYLPFSAFLYLPLSLLPLSAAKGIWYGIVLVSLALIFFLALKLLHLDKRKSLTIGFLSFLILARYLFREVQLGQINALITFLLLLMMSLLIQGKSLARRQAGSGIFLGLSTALKPYAAIFFPYFIIRKKYLTLGAGIIVLGLAVLAPSMFYGLRGNFKVLWEWQSSLRASTPSLFSSQDNISLVGFFTKWTSRQNLSLAFYLISLAVLAGLVLVLILRKAKTPEPGVLDGFLLLSLIPLISPLGWDYTLLSSAPAVMLVLSHFDKYSSFWKAILCLNFAVIALSLFDLMGREPYARFMSWSVITVNFLVLIGFLAYLRVRGHA